MNNYSQIVQPAKFVAPQDLNLLLKGTMYKQDMAEKNLSHVQSAVDNILSIPAYGKDKEVLNNLIQELQSSLSSLDTTNLNDPRSTQQINELINSYSNNPDIKNIAQRGFSYENEIAKKKEAEAKGKTYVSPIINQAEKYFNSGEYVKDKQFNEVGWISPEIEKLKAEALKNVPKVTKNKKVGNYWTSVESYDNDALQSTLSEIYSRPDVQRDLNYRMQQEYEANGVDFTTEATQEAQTIMQKAQIALQIDPTDTKAQKVLDNYSLLLSSPEKLTEAYKRRKANESVQKYIQSDIAAADFESEGKMDADDFDLKYVDHVYKLDEIRVQGEKEIAVNIVKDKLESTKLPEVDKLVYTAVLNSGKPIYDATGNLIPVNQLASENGIAYNPKESRDGKTSLSTPDTKIIVGDKSYKISEVEQNIKSGNKEMIKNIISQYIEPLEGDEDIEIDEENGKIFYEKEGVSNSNSFGWDKVITIDNLLAKVRGDKTASEKKYKGIDNNGDPILE